MSSAHDHANDHGDGEHANSMAHVASVQILLRTGITLLVLTALTVGATKFDFGGSMNLAVAMLIAVIKATLVILFFMHLRYDKIFHAVIFVSALLAATLFVGYTLMDSGQYQSSNIWNPDHPPAAPNGPRPLAP